MKSLLELLFIFLMTLAIIAGNYSFDYVLFKEDFAKYCWWTVVVSIGVMGLTMYFFYRLIGGPI